MENKWMAEAVVGNLPLWLKVSIVLGFPTFVASVLLFALLGWIPSPMTMALASLQAQAETLARHERDSQAQRAEFIQTLQYQSVIMRSICRGIVPAANQHQCEPTYRGYEERVR
jgi:hypothetical protein